MTPEMRSELERVALAMIAQGANAEFVIVLTGCLERPDSHQEVVPGVLFGPARLKIQAGTASMRELPMWMIRETLERAAAAMARDPRSVVPSEEGAAALASDAIARARKVPE